MNTRHFTEQYLIPGNQGNIQHKDPQADEFERLAGLDNEAQRERDASQLAKEMQADMNATTLKEYPVSTRILSISNSVEGWIEGKAKASSQKSREKSAAKYGGLGRNKLATEIRAIGSEIKWRSGVQTAIGAATILGIATGGVGFAAGGALLAVRTAHRTMRGLYQGEKRLAEGRNIGDKIEVDDDASRIAKFGTGVSNLVSKPERYVTKKALGKGEYSTRKRVGVALLGALALPAAARGFRAVGDFMNGTAAYAKPSSSAEMTQATTTGTGGTSAPAESILPGRGTAIAPLEGSTGGSSAPAETYSGGPNGTGTLATEQSASKPTGENYLRSEGHTHDKMSTGGAFDETHRSSKELDDHVLRKIGNNPTLASSVLEVRESGSMEGSFSTNDVNADTHGSAVGGRNGEYSAKGEKNLSTVEKTWNNGKQGELLSNKEVSKLQSKYNFINHGVDEGKYKNAIDDKMYSAGKFDYRPDLGDKIYAKELGNGKICYFKVNAHDSSRDCLNVLTLQEKPPTPSITTTPGGPPNTHEYGLKTGGGSTGSPGGSETTTTPGGGTTTTPGGNSPKGPVSSDSAGPTDLGGQTFGNDAPETQQTPGGQTAGQAEQQVGGGAGGSTETAPGATPGSSDAEQGAASPGASGQTSSGTVPQ